RCLGRSERRDLATPLWLNRESCRHTIPYSEDFNIQLPTFNDQVREQDMTPHRHCCHPQTHARMIHEFV
ncbi:MAG: hypothetical protein NTW21_08970, partial [Verrucomicrobia bacterium]|nr:hypothetical protein [Verrucomicrobiota bacterium]